MIVGCYTLDCYCDIEKPTSYPGKPGHHERGEFPHRFTGENKAECIREARCNGWVFKRDGVVLCPKCSGKRKEAPNA